jgi:hypothetical protein
MFLHCCDKRDVKIGLVFGKLGAAVSPLERGVRNGGRGVWLLGGNVPNSHTPRPTAAPLERGVLLPSAI